MSETNVVQLHSPDRPRRTRRTTRPAVPAGIPLTALLSSWEIALTAQKKADYTIELYTRSARMFIAFLGEEGFPCDAEGVTAEHVRLFLISEERRTSVHTSSAHHSYLGVWFNWIIAEGDRTTFSPVLKADKPHVPKKARKYLSDEELAAILAACKRPAPKEASPAAKALHDFAARRDTAIIRIFMDNGVRVSGLSGLQVDDVDLRGRRLRIRLKGGDEHWAPIGDKAAQALDRYLRLRARSRHASSPNLWLGVRGKSVRGMTRSGVQKMLKVRGEQAGVEHVHPHRFRGTAAHNLLAAGADRGDVRLILGWKSDAMLAHYTEELSEARARATHARLSPGDRI